MARRSPLPLERFALVAVILAIAIPAATAVALLGGRERVQPVAATPFPVRRPAPAPGPKPAQTAATATEGSTPLSARVASVIRRPDQFDYGAWLWNADRAPAGPMLITVDLRAQLIRVWRGGHEIGVSTILYGAPDSPTPLGTFPITQKDAHHVSNIFHSPMPYSLRLTNDGVMVHGSNVRAGWASNGCVGVPTDFAKALFGVVKLGDKVVITDGKALLRVGDALPVG